MDGRVDRWVVVELVSGLVVGWHGMAWDGMGQHRVRLSAGKCHACVVGWAQRGSLAGRATVADLTRIRDSNQGSASEPHPARVIRSQILIQEIVGSMLENGQEHPESMMWMWVWNGRVASCVLCEGQLARNVTLPVGRGLRGG